MKDAGARREPNNPKIFSVNANGATADGVKNSTKAIQQTIDSCSKNGGGIVTFSPGQYVTGALFLKSNVNLRVPAGVTLLGSQHDADYPSLSTRVAGIEMDWPADPGLRFLYPSCERNRDEQCRGRLPNGRSQAGVCPS